jgi:DNA-directed RNA polymerase specialized sigma24 family protein
MPHAISAVAAALGTEEASDAELAFPARRGSASAFRAIVERNDRRLFRGARGVLKDGAETEDAVQATCHRAVANLHVYFGSTDLSARRASSSSRRSRHRPIRRHASRPHRQRRCVARHRWSAAGTDASSLQVLILNHPLRKEEP